MTGELSFLTEYFGNFLFLIFNLVNIDKIHINEKSLESSISLFKHTMEPHGPKILRTDELDNSKGSFSAENGHGVI